MTLIKIKNRYVVPLHILARLALKYIYDKEHMSFDEEDKLKRGIVYWTKKVDITEEEQFNLERIGKVMKRDEDGELEDRKELFKKHDIHWAKFHRIPDMVD